ncbi:MAG: AAA family ATPase [Delftia tsuruhatensis]
MIIHTATKDVLSKTEIQSLTGWLGELLVAQQYAKLSEGGHVQNAIPLKNLFIDLPANENPGSINLRDKIFESLESAPFVKAKDLFANSNNIALNTLSEDKEEARFAKEMGTLSAVLLIGGPGQGKSTVGQLICQLHRANLLKGSRQLTTAQKDTTEDYAKKTPGDVYLKARTRGVLPIQINLPDFAAWLAKTPREKSDPGNSLAFKYICQTPSAVENDLRPLVLLNACRQISVQLVFDGFDEVGSQSERLRLVTECHNLIRDLADISANIRILVTTRPQGYTEEFEKIGFKLKKLYLLPLQVEEALSYAHRLIKAKMPSADERSRAMDQINTAVIEPATRRLFTTPLQITIITALVQQMGNAPRERWNLFAGYFDYTYKREVERRTFASNLLRDQRQNIEQMHARVGLLLQVRAELDGGASSRMKRPELESIINDILEEEEIAPIKKQQLISDIATAAEDRLVFLTQPEPENYGFEVRSLQEFFAAWALTTGSQSDIEKRLTQIARASAFKNVYLFCASRIFGSIPTYRDIWINNVCKHYDNPKKDDFGASIKAGSIIALETLEEGVADNQPKYSKILMGLASGVLELPAGREHLRLAHICTPDNSPQLETALSSILSNENSKLKLAAWITLLECLSLKHSWSFECAERFFAKSELPTITLAINSNFVTISDWLATKIEQNLQHFNPNLILHFRSTTSTSTWIGKIVSIALFAKKRDWWSSPLFIGLSQNEKSENFLHYSGDVKWDIYIAWLKFEQTPNVESLAEFCEKLADSSIDLSQELLFHTAWPVTAIIKSTNSPDDLIKTAKLLRAGQLGDEEQWLAAQHAWVNVDFPDFEKVLRATNSSLPWDILRIQTTPPMQAYAHTVAFGKSIDSASKAKKSRLKNHLTQILSETSFRHLQKDCAEILLSWFIENKKDLATQSSEINNWISQTDRIGYSLFGRISQLPTALYEKFLAKINRGSFLGRLSDLASAIVDTKGDPRIIDLATESLRTHFELFDSSADSQNHTVIDKAYQLIRSNSIETETGTTFIWNLAIQINSGWRDFSNIDLTQVCKLGAIPVSNLLQIAASESPAFAEKFALSLISVDAILSQRRIVFDAMQEIFIKRLSELGQPAIWAKLNMGFYYCTDVGVENSGNVSDISPISKLHISNVRGISELNHEFVSIDKDTGQFIILIGENGAGKTTILRAVALALRDSSDLSIWPSGAFSSAWRSESLDAASHGKIHLEFLDQSFVETTITAAGQFRQLRSKSSFNRPVYAYGCYRGSALGGPHGTVTLGEDGGPGIATLFDPEARLINAESWLIQLEARSLKEPERAHAFKTVIRAMSQLLGLQNLDIRSGNLYATTEDGRVLPFNALSDGYLSMSGWFIDVIARLVDYQDRNNIPLTEKFLSEAQCYILIDEIDAHIHPGWQMDVIFRAKNIFPKCVFIVTTHNPLTLAGASPHEILQLKRVGGNVSLIRGSMPPILLTGGQLYKQYFGIEQVIPSGLAKLIGEKLTLESKPNLSTSEALKLKCILDELDKIEIEGWEHL